MVQFKDAQTYFEQSKLLIQARPSTTRISTKYTVPRARPSSKRQRPRKAVADAGGDNAASTTPATTTPAPPKATLTLKTYDPVSGTCLKYMTDKQAEVGRLIAGLGRLARDSAALPEKPEGEAPAPGSAGDGTSTPMDVDTASSAPAAQTTQQQGKQGGGGGGGGKKKKGKGKK